MYNIDGKCSDSIEGTVLTKIGEGEYSFTSSFYNGGTCISEQLTEGLEIKKREEKKEVISYGSIKNMI